MNTNYDLFGNPIPNTNDVNISKNIEEKATSVELVLSENASNKDSKNKKAIEKKIQKIDTLKAQIKKIHEDITFIKQAHKEMVSEDEIAFFKLKEAFAIKLYKRFNEKGFTLWQKDMIEDMIMETCVFLTSNAFISETLQNIQEEIFEARANTFSDEEKEVANEIFENFFAEMGVDMDMEDFDFTKFTQEEFYAKFHEKQHEEKTEFDHQQKAKKTQQTDKLFQKLYKDLVKKAHPDLVIDENEKTKREEWMKKLSEAWQHRNYYQLLILKKEIDTNNDIKVSLESDQLKSLTQQLNEEIRQLDVEKWRLKNNDENGFYYTHFFARSKKGIEKKLKEYKKHITYQKQYVQTEIDNLKTKVSTKNFLKEVYENAEIDPFDFLDDNNYH